MSWLITAKQYIPAVIGEPFGGGYFAGYISHTANGQPTHALIVAPRATGATGTGYTLTTNLEHKMTNDATTGTDSEYDGAANTASMTSTLALRDEHPAAKFCDNLTIGGYDDWYLPAKAELEIAYFNLKPDSTANNTSSGVNIYSVPRRAYAYTSANPFITGVSLFANAGSESFVSLSHWSSSQFTASPSIASLIVFSTGQLVNNNKSLAIRVRAFRRIAL